MALRFRTPHIEELPTAQTRQAPGFAWVAVPAGAGIGGGGGEDPSKAWGAAANRKRQRTSALGQSESQREALSVRQSKEVDRRIKELNADGSGTTGRGAAGEVQVPAVVVPKIGGGPGGGGGAVKAGKTPNTKKILGSGKTFAHYLDDEEAEIARTGRRDGDLPALAAEVGGVLAGVTAAVPTATTTQRASKTPIARRKTQVQAQTQLVREESSQSNTPAPAPTSTRFQPPPLPSETDESDELISPLPSQAELDALLAAPPLTYNQARSAPPPPGMPPPRRFCQICGFWGRVKCLKCGDMTCSVLCKDAHDEHKCLKFYA